MLHLLLARSGIHVFFIVQVGGRLVWNVPSSVTKTSHDILGYSGISKVLFQVRFKTSNQVKLGYLIFKLNMHIPV